ncbi:MAG: MgtC/SapB family protein [Thermoplasmatota archaeon]
MEEWLEIILKLVISLAASGLIGLEREVTGHKAGIRTQILVGIGSTSFIMLGVYSDIEVSENGRILAGLATGLGFLGAGAIMKEGLNVKGLTTAASIWVNASIGAAIGMGEYLIGMTAVVITLMVLSIFAVIEKYFRLKPNDGHIYVNMDHGKACLNDLITFLEKKNIKIDNVRVISGDKQTKASLSVCVGRTSKVYQIIEELENWDSITEVQWDDQDSSGPLNYLDILRP